MPNGTVEWHWATQILAGSDVSAAQALAAHPDTALILINTVQSAPVLHRLWPLVSMRICADGAANRLSDVCSELVPDLIIGDFDSVSKDVLDAFKDRGVPVQDLHEDQDTTDLEKALAAARKSGCIKAIIVGQHAGFEGRLDHFFGIANTLHLYMDLPSVVIGEESYMCLLAPGEHQLYVPHAAKAPYCGLVPLGVPCDSISTTGLKWDMTDTKMEFGGLVSVCNRVEPSSEGRVWVKTSSPVLWTCTL